MSTVAHKDSNSRQMDRYEDQFLHVSAFVEKWLLRVLGGLLALILIVQLLLQFPGVRYNLVKVEQLEGVSFTRAKEAKTP